MNTNIARQGYAETSDQGHMSGINYQRSAPRMHFPQMFDQNVGFEI
jgi:hypothetical protein